MAIYVMLTKLSPESLTRPESVIELERQAESRIKSECQGVKWIANYATLGPYDYLDIYDAPDVETATKVALLVRSFGHATTETWLATEWDRFATLVKEMKG